MVGLGFLKKFIFAPFLLSLSFSGHSQTQVDDSPHAYVIDSLPDESGRRFMVTGLESENDRQRREIFDDLKDEYLMVLKENPDAELIVKAEVKGDVSKSEADFLAYSMARDIAALSPRIQLSEFNAPLDEETKKVFLEKRAQEKSYKFALMRGISNTGVTMLYLQITTDLSLSWSMGVGALAGMMSYSLSRWSEEYFKMIEKPSFVTRTFTRQEDLQNAHWALKKGDALWKLFAVEVLYIGIIKACLMGLEVDHDTLGVAVLNVGLAALYGFAQDTWDLSFTETRRRMERLKTHTKNYIDHVTQKKYFSIAITSMALVMGQVLGIPSGEHWDVPYTVWGYIATGAIGGGFLLRSIYRTRVTQEQQEEAMRSRPQLTCFLHLSIK